MNAPFALGRSNGWIVVRAITLVFIIFCVSGFFIGSLYYLGVAERYPADFTAWGWTPEEIDLIFSRVGLSFNWWIKWNFVSSIVFSVFICGIGVFLFIRRGSDWFGLYIATSFIMFGTMSGYSTRILAVIYPALEAVLALLGVLSWVMLILVFFLFPNGVFVPAWTRWVAVLLLIVFSADIVIYHGATPPPFLLLPIMLSIAMGPISQAYRYRKVSNAVERQQTKWVLFAMIVVMIVLLFGLTPLFSPDSIDPASPTALLMAFYSVLGFYIVGLIPLSITFAILRYRLWDVDVLIRRTLQYTLLTGVLALIYFGGVVFLQGLLGAFTDLATSPLVTVITTLGIAVLFNPLRQRILEFIDRRFYRSKFNAEQTLARFAAVAREEVDLDQLSLALLGAVSETMQPEDLSIWLKQIEVGRWVRDYR